MMLLCNRLGQAFYCFIFSRTSITRGHLGRKRVKHFWRRIIKIDQNFSVLYVHILTTKTPRKIKWTVPTVNLSLLLMRHFHLVCPPAFTCFTWRSDSVVGCGISMVSSYFYFNVFRTSQKQTGPVVCDYIEIIYLNLLCFVRMAAYLIS